MDKTNKNSEIYKILQHCDEDSDASEEVPNFHPQFQYNCGQNFAKALAVNRYDEDSTEDSSEYSVDSNGSCEEAENEKHQNCDSSSTSGSKGEDEDENLESLGNIEPLFDLVIPEPEDIKLELICVEKNNCSSVKQFILPGDEQLGEFVAGINSQLFQEQKDKGMGNKVLKNLKRIGKRFSKLKLNEDEEELTNELRTNGSSEEQLHRSSAKERAKRETFVERFSWNPLVQDCVQFEGKNHSKPICSKTSPSFYLPNWLSEAPTAEASEQFEERDKLSSIISKECSRLQNANLCEWERALEFGGQNNCQDFRRIFLYMSSKLEIVECPILSLGYSKGENSNLLAVGSVGGVLKLIQFAELKGKRELSAMVVRNEGLQGHLSAVDQMKWVDDRLMTTDVQGVIIGWKISDQPGQQTVQFVQDKCSSKILGFSWSPLSNRIAIIYADRRKEELPHYGIVVADCTGKRKWGKSLPFNGHSHRQGPQAVGWVDDESLLLMQNNSLTLYDKEGQVLLVRHLEDELFQFYLTDNYSSTEKLVALLVQPTTAWDNNTGFKLALIWEQHIMFLRAANDKRALHINPKLRISSSDWSPNGIFVAVGGLSRDEGSQVNIYNCGGSLLTTLRVDESSKLRLSAISWDADSSHLAIGCGNILYVAAVRPVVKFASNGVLHAYAYAEYSRNFLAIWDGKMSISQPLEGKVVDLKNHGERFVILTLSPQGLYTSAVLNKAGVVVDVHVILSPELNPFAIVMTDGCVAHLGKSSLLIWRYKSSFSAQDSKSSVSRLIHIDEEPEIIERVRFGRRKLEGTEDVAVCMDAKGDRLIVARNSGKLQIYCLPQGALLQTTKSHFAPFQLLINPTGSSLALLDIKGTLRLAQIQEKDGIQLQVTKEPAASGVLNMIWAQDLPNFLCVLKRNEMSILFNGSFESFPNYDAMSGYLAGFHNMTITLINFEEILASVPSRPSPSSLMTLDLQILEYTAQAYASGNDAEISLFKENAEKISHPRLWGVVGVGELRRKNWEEAGSAFAHAKSYSELQFLNKVRGMPLALADAEIAAFLGEYEQASKLYVIAGRKDLALELWKLLDDPRQIAKVLEASTSGSDTKFPSFSVEDGERYFAKGEMSKAREIFKGLGQYSRVLDSILVQDGDDEGRELRRLTKTAKDNRDEELLAKIAQKYSFWGMTQDAVDIYLDCEQPSKAVDCALSNLDWKLALEIGAEFRIPMISKSVGNFAKNLLSTGNIMQAVHFLKNAGKNFTAGALLTMASLKELEKERPHLQSTKKLFAMAALLLQVKNIPQNQNKLDDEDSIIPEQYKPSADQLRWMRTCPWRGVTAIQYFILVQKLLHTGHFDRAIVVATHLRHGFCDILGTERVNCVLALASSQGQNLFQALGALSVLESLEGDDYAELAPELLAKEWSTGYKTMCCGMPLMDDEKSCPLCDLKLPICILSGKLLKDDVLWSCSQCAGNVSKKRIKRYANCPLCHQTIVNVQSLNFN